VSIEGELQYSVVGIACHDLEAASSRPKTSSSSFF
jgi:hypothetical protein